MAGIDAASLSALIGSIYEAALDSRRWPVFLSEFAARMNSHAALIWAHDFSSRTSEVQGTDGIISCTLGFDEAALGTFAQYYSERNVWTEDPLRHKTGGIVTSSSLYCDRLLKRSEYYNDWLKPQDFFYSSAAIVEKQADRSLNVTLMRQERAGTYNEQETQLIGLLMPHLQAAFALHRRLYRLDALEQATLGVLEYSPFGIALLDEQARVIYSNQLAHSLARQSGLLNFTAGGTLTARYAADNARLYRRLKLAVRTGLGAASEGGGTLRLHGLGGARLDLVITPLPSWASPFGERSAAAVFFSDPNATIGSLAERLRALYGMTRAEAQLTEALANGLTPKEYAERQQLSVHTVRAQFKAAAAKAGTRRQADLLRIVLTGPAVLRFAGPVGPA
ncbi:helix-turn-helix transcriptional regulator [Pseudomonas sp. NPDC007930]|uniref:helix-turn-helix transcriptional regulator n=1 Tax=Pseudomonas sp. NPDC007930 TaxID=3364417 RepID=UPI0036E89132